MLPLSSWRRFAAPAVLGAAACAACCAPPLVGLVIGAGAASALAAFIEPLAAILLASAAIALGLVLLNQRRQAAAAAAAAGGAGCGCGPESGEPRLQAVETSDSRVQAGGTARRA